MTQNHPESRREDVSAAARLLQGAFSQAPRLDEPAWLLARYYHRGLLSRLGAARKLPQLRDNQITGLLNSFYALAQRPGAQAPHRELVSFLKLCPWVDRHPRAPILNRLRQEYPRVLLALARRELESFAALRPEADAAELLRSRDFPVTQLLEQGLETVYAVWYIPRAIRSSLKLLIALNPRDEYPQARAMRRHFVIHVGGTNTGKTYAGFQKLIRAGTGVYLGPLRLLALEAQDYLLGAGVQCGLTTGEEEDLRPTDTHVAATAEKLDLDAWYECAVIDECQMIADPQRGYAWTRAILGIRAKEIHLCCAPEAQSLLIRLIQSCRDSYTLEQHRRKTPLVVMNHTIEPAAVRPGDALITFSKVGVLTVAEQLRQAGKEPAIIYGALPYATRRRQMEGFLEGRMEYVVSTDAIGMGLNLPIRRIIFMETEKFDGTQRRPLKPEEIQQIAGRAGRYGMYNKGFVGATEDLEVIRDALQTQIPPLTEAVVGFSELVLQVDYDLLEVLIQWNKMPTVKPYVKLDISRYIQIITKMRENGYHLPKELELRAANIPFDETEPALMETFFHYLYCYQQGLGIQQPGIGEDGQSLQALELYCRKLDLYFSFCRSFGLPVDEDRLYDSREDAAEEINEILLHRLRSNILFCQSCGAPLPLGDRRRFCAACYRRTGTWRG